ncbi:MAG TPA: TIGR02466 family protein [Paracoccaceae bacterium]|nr:TIGR02466 family protein [Paracoccaceae bacterium]
MPQIASLFVTRLYRAALNEGARRKVDADELQQACRSLAAEDTAGQAWCRANGYAGYTSYASLSDLPWRMPVFADLQRVLDRHVEAFAADLGFALGRRRLKCNALWVNVLPKGAGHAGHIHPQSVISGTTYVTMPPGASALRLEDPRLPMMMMAPQRRPDADEGLRPFVYVQPEAGEVLLWESWLRHEVPVNGAEGDRISVSFNYA